MSGLLVSLEGISGVGKTYYEKLLHKSLQNEKVLFLSEITDRTGSNLDNKIITTLKSTKSKFFDSGFPLTETFLLLALKMFDYENIIRDALDKNYIVIENRSIDTIAIYQAILLCSDNGQEILTKMINIFDLAARYRKVPDITFLLVDDFNVSVKRAENRDNYKYTKKELYVLKKAYELYNTISLDSQRISKIDLREENNEVDVITKIKKLIFSRC